MPILRRLLVVLLLLTLAGASGASITGNLSPTIKDPGVPYVNPPVRVNGDTVDDPFVVPGSLPQTVTGTTAGFANDYDEVCPYSGSTAPDVVYSFTLTSPYTLAINIDLCYSSYDTKLYVHQDASTPGAPFACNDDYYFAAPCYTYSSFLGMVPVAVGHTYYIVIDGYGSANGAYSCRIDDGGLGEWVGACCFAGGGCSVVLEPHCTGIWQGPGTTCIPNPCVPLPQVECPPGSLVEIEDNGGCNSTPHTFQPIHPQAEGCATMCGTAWANYNSRDTDWYLSFGTGETMTGTAVGEFGLQYLLIYGTDCAAPSYYLATADPGVPVTLSCVVDDGAEVWNWLGCAVFANWPEGDYVFDVCGIQDPPPPPGACCVLGACMVVTPELCQFADGTFIGPAVPCVPDPCQPVAIERRSWGALKSLYR